MCSSLLVLFGHAMGCSHVQVFDECAYAIDKLLILWTVLENLPQILDSFELIISDPDNLFMHAAGLVQL